MVGIGICMKLYAFLSMIFSTSGFILIYHINVHKITYCAQSREVLYIKLLSTAIKPISNITLSRSSGIRNNN